MASKKSEVYVFSHIGQADGHRFVPSGILGLTETDGANVQIRELASEFAYGTGYLDRKESFELDPVSLAFEDRQSIKGKALFPVNGLGEFGGIRDAAPDTWGRRVIEARLRAPANSLLEVQYLLHAGGDRVGALDVREDRTSPDSPSASDMHSLQYVLQAAEAVENGAPVPANLENFLGAGPSAGGARPKAAVRDDDGALWLAKFPAKGDTFDVARAETCTLELARRCALTVPEVRYLDLGGRLDLSATDILKADILGGLTEEQRDIYTQRWEETEEDLGREAFGELFSHIRMVFRKAKPQSTLLKEFKAHVAPEQNPRAFMDAVLLPMADAFEELISASYASQTKAEEVNEQLRWLNRLEFKDWVPPALVFFVRHRNEPSKLLSFFADLERLGYSLLIRRSGVNDRIERFSKLTTAIEKGDDLSAAGSPLQLSPLEQDEVYRRLDGPLYESLAPRVLAVLLMRLDRLVADKQATYRHAVVSVEHVMPQQPAPRSQWQEWVPDAQAHQYWVHRLGNLALLSRNKNSSASNRDFDWKKSSYFTKGGISSFALTTQVLQHPEWTVDVMALRQADLMQTLEQHWRLQGRQSQEAVAEALLAKLDQGPDGLVFELESARHGLSAFARETGDALLVLAGSQAKLAWNGQPHSYQQLREDLVAHGVLKLSADELHWEFTRDTPFKSPSAASAVVLGRTDNGRNSWRIKGTTVTYAAWQDNLPATQAASGRAES